jgi:dihydroflavonol-4-reductase
MNGSDAAIPTGEVVKALPGQWDGREPDPSDWPVLVTGAGGFVGGHIARGLAGAGHRVRGLTRRPPRIEPGDPPIEWLVGDLRDAEVQRRAVVGVRGVIHTASWVCLGLDPHNTSRAINVEATTSLLAEAARSGVERFVYTSTLYTLAAGTADEPADEFTAWNLGRVESPYTRTKREAERRVLEASDSGLSTIAICPGMVMGPRDDKPTSTTIVRSLARYSTVVLPPGGIPIVDVRVVATAHRRSLVAGGPGTRYAVVGPYLSYPELATVVASIAGRPRRVLTLGDRWEPILARAAEWTAPLVRRWIPDLSRQLVAGGFLRLHVDGRRADVGFGLQHPPAAESIAASLVE